MQIIMTQQFKTIHYLFISRGNQILLVSQLEGGYCCIIYWYTDHWEPGRRNNIMYSWRRSSSVLLSRSTVAGEDCVEVEVLDDEGLAGVDGDLGRR